MIHYHIRLKLTVLSVKKLFKDLECKNVVELLILHLVR